MTNADLLTLLAISLAQLLAMVSPGPAFMLVSRTAAAQSREAGLATGLGVATAATIWAVSATFGVAVLLSRFPALYGAIQLAGAVYLISLGLAAWRDHDEGEAAGPAVDGGRAFRRGLWLSLSNPKIVFFYGGIFVSMLPADAPAWLVGTALLMVIAQEFLWYSSIPLVFSRPRVQSVYRRWRRRIERVMGAVFVAFGARVAALAHF